MKKLLLLFCFFGYFLNGYCQQAPYWQQVVNYTINVTLDEAARSLDGYVKMQYFNNSPDTLTYIWIHCWANAYKNDRTAFSDQRLENGNTDFYFSDEEKRGYINRLDFKVGNKHANISDHPQHQDVIRLNLPEPLLPGTSTMIETAFHVQLPFNWSRSGYTKDAFQLTQWYPKPAVYDRKGWHEMPYLDQGEFYSEFGKYDVTINAPEKFTIAATGNLLGQSAQDTIKTYHFVQDKVHDFAWFADKHFVVKTDTLQLDGRTIKVAAYYHESSAKIWEKSVGYIKAAIKTKSDWVGNYPYDVVSVVELNRFGGDGMEYPTITLLSSPPNEKILDYLINHEVGHNWFYGILATNERQHPWMDEGMNSYYDDRYTRQQYGIAGFNVMERKDKFTKKHLPYDFSKVLLQTVISMKKDQPIEIPADKFSESNYFLTAYTKTAEWLGLLESKMGTAAFDSAMKLYYKTWQFKHPYPEDFKAIVEQVKGTSMDSFFDLLNSTGAIVPPAKKDIRLTGLFNLKDADKHNYIAVAPAAGFNYYDGLMPGVLFHNYSLPSSKFRFFAAPMYALKSKQLNGLGRLDYRIFSGKRNNRLDIFSSFAHFSADDFLPKYAVYRPTPYEQNYVDSTGKRQSQPFTKIVPGARFTFANKDPRSSLLKYIQWKTFLIRETGLSFSRDTVNFKDVFKYPKTDRYLNQLQFVIRNDRALYPYDGTLQVEQGESFARATFEGNYFFNYKDGGGMNVRFFAGKFFYTKPYSITRMFETDRYHLNMTGANGYEDYTYSNYFVGRNEFSGISSQQLMIRDGGLKIRTDLLSGKIAKTDDWLSSLNFTTTIPKKINPLSLLPFKLPLRIFADVGTYAEAWDKNANTSKFLYDAGLQLSLFNDAITVYVPLFYSKLYKDYLKSYVGEKYFSKNISFSINLHQFTPQNLLPQIPF